MTFLGIARAGHHTISAMIGWPGRVLPRPMIMASARVVGKHLGIRHEQDSVIYLRIVVTSARTFSL